MTDLELLDAALDGLGEAIAERDLPRALAAFCAAREPEVVGSEVGETARGHDAVAEFFRRAYAKAGFYRFEFPERRWTVAAGVAWCVAEGTVTEPGRTRATPYRLAAVFVREDGDWRMALWSGAEPRGAVAPPT